MGVQSFMVESWGRTALTAFNRALDNAEQKHEPLAEKSWFKMVLISPGEEPKDVAEELLKETDTYTFISSKQNTAGCIRIPKKHRETEDGRVEHKYLFFGWASS